MAELINRFSVAFSSTMDMSEPELRALDALTRYGDDAFVRTFYQHLGTSVLKPHEKGLRTLFASIRASVSPALSNIDEARALLKQTGKDKP